MENVDRIMAILILWKISNKILVWFLVDSKKIPPCLKLIETEKINIFVNRRTKGKRNQVVEANRMQFENKNPPLLPCIGKSLGVWNGSGLITKRAWGLHCFTLQIQLSLQLIIPKSLTLFACFDTFTPTLVSTLSLSSLYPRTHS